LRNRLRRVIAWLSGIEILCRAYHFEALPSARPEEHSLSFGSIDRAKRPRHTELKTGGV
jgi:hypothetical protein